MAQLNSPGVSVTVIDESFYTPAAPGTVPLIIVASAEGKPNASSTGTAPGTLKVNTGQVYLLTSQKELVDTFGTPTFYTDANSNPIHAGEMNEYGLQAAYSYLGVSNRAYVVRADLDLSQLGASSNIPTGLPDDGAYWFDTTNTYYGIFEWNSASAIAGGQVFTNRVPTVITDSEQVEDFEGGDYTPKKSIGKVGSYAIVAVTTTIKLWYKKAATNGILPSGTWVEVGSPAWVASRPSAQGIIAPTIANSATFVVEVPSLSITKTITGATGTLDSVDEVIAAINADSNLSNAGITAGKNPVTEYLELYSTGLSFELSGNALQTLMGLKDSAGVTIDGTATSVMFLAPELAMSPHFNVPTFKRSDNTSSYNGNPTGSVWVKTTSPNLGAHWSVKRFNATTELWQTKSAPLYKSNVEALYNLDKTGGGINLPLGTVYVKYNDSEASPNLADFKIYVRSASGPTVITSSAIDSTTFANGDDYSFTIAETAAKSDQFKTAQTVSFTGTSGNEIDTIIAKISEVLVDSQLTVKKSPAGNQIIITHAQGGDIKFVDGQNDPIVKLFADVKNVYSDPAGGSNDYVASLWVSSVKNSAGDYVAFATPSPTALSNVPEDGTLWYDSNVSDVDIMIHDGTNWKGYANVDHTAGTNSDDPDPNGPIVSASQPTSQYDGTSLANGDLWIDTSDEENYPKIHRYDYTLEKWILLDKTDQTTENGILFHDARWAVDGRTSSPSTIIDLLSSDYLDFDAPDPALYPKGMLLWNLRRSGFNVKKFTKNYVDLLDTNPRQQVITNISNGEYVDEPMGSYRNDNGDLIAAYYPHRWLSWAPNQADGSGSFGRMAQRGVVVRALQALVNSNQQIRDDEGRIFNLIACPGYPELIGEMISLNVDRGLTAFVVGDCPARLTPDATSLSNWGNNVNNVLEDNDKGLVSYDEYMAVYYPWGYSSDNLGNNIAVPPSHMMLRTIALSDNVSYPWFAPAGTRRGGITNASAVGYVTSEGEFQSVSLNVGQRDTLQQICKVNPITFINGAGIICYGQKTRARNASALDRVNVARLVVYLRRQFTQLAKPYIFEPNDKITRDEIKGAAESLLLELVGQRALYDYIVVCDTSNNTPARIDRNELYLDVAIEPVKAVEFIYIPLRLKNTGTIQNIASQ